MSDNDQSDSSKSMFNGQVGGLVLVTRESDADTSHIDPANSDWTSSEPLRSEVGVIDPANKVRTLDGLFAETAARDAALVRIAFPVSQIRVEKDRLVAGGQEFVIGESGMRRLCKHLDAPADYLATLKPELRARILREHFAEGRRGTSKLTDKTSCVVSRGQTFLDLGRMDLCTLDATAVVQAVCDGVGNAPTLEVAAAHFDDESCILDVVSPQLYEEVRPGDVLRAGIHVEHSYCDGEATKIMAYVLRLVCGNGLVQRECLGENHRSTPRTRRLSSARPEAREMQMAQIRMLVADTWKGMQSRLNAIRELREKPVNIRTTLERFLRQAHLFSHALMALLLDAWQQEAGEETAFGALNAMTRVATHSAKIPKWKRQRLARLAGVYANQDVHLCPHCFSVINS